MPLFEGWNDGVFGRIGVTITTVNSNIERPHHHPFTQAARPNVAALFGEPSRDYLRPLEQVSGQPFTVTERERFGPGAVVECLLAVKGS